MKLFKTDPEAVGIVTENDETVVFANEDVTVEFGEFKAVCTGVALMVEKGAVLLLAETQPMGLQGVTVTGKLVTHHSTNELRVGILNQSRTAFKAVKGAPIARLVELQSRCVDFEEVETLEEWDQELKDLKEEMTDEDKKSAELNSGSVTNGPGKNPSVTGGKKPGEDGSGKKDKAKPPGTEAKPPGTPGGPTDKGDGKPADGTTVITGTKTITPVPGAPGSGAASNVGANKTDGGAGTTTG